MAQQLSASEKLFQAVVQTATDAIIMWDQHGAIVLWNKGARTMFGYAAAEVVGKPLTLIMPPAVPPSASLWDGAGGDPRGGAGCW